MNISGEYVITTKVGNKTIDLGCTGITLESDRYKYTTLRLSKEALMALQVGKNYQFELGGDTVFTGECVSINLEEACFKSNE